MTDAISREAAKQLIRDSIGERVLPQTRARLLAALDTLPSVEPAQSEAGSDPTDDFWTNLANETVEHVRKALADLKS